VRKLEVNKSEEESDENLDYDFIDFLRGKDIDEGKDFISFLRSEESQSSEENE